ncbi:hypothetical protein CDL12_13600 [Handroanthus impetiginosus]|uniref:Uncharacterized protein n=1 Tax=Handroanthus impetiginosus TaxID=429701 RepID=A0A2G9H8B7_9LAMI|nr:hypothetical protein CDL12_13600 [Handroanthus impetiginosus]
MFYEVAEDTHVYQHMSLDDFPLVAWKSLSEKQQAFLTRYEESQNPKVMYKQVVCLQRAEKLKHICKNACRKKSIWRELKLYCDKLINMLKLTWVENSLMKDHPLRCIEKDNHKKRID